MLQIVAISCNNMTMALSQTVQTELDYQKKIDGLVVSGDWPFFVWWRMITIEVLLFLNFRLAGGRKSFVA